MKCFIDDKSISICDSCGSDQQIKTAKIIVIKPNNYSFNVKIELCVKCMEHLTEDSIIAMTREPNEELLFRQ